MTESAELVDVWFNTIKQHRTLGSFYTQQPLTPFLLIEEITQQLSLDSSTRVCVFYTIEWAIYLRVVVGVKDITVAVQDHDPAVKNLCNHWGFEYQKNILHMTNPPKFDVVVGNPPYQNGENSAFYKLFVSKAKSLSTTVAFVVPSSLFKDSSEFRGVQHYAFKSCAFQGIQLVVSWFVWSKDFGGPCYVHFPDGGMAAVSEIVVAPTTSAAQFNLVDRLLKKKLPGFVIACGTLSRNKTVPDRNGIKCIWSAGRKDQEFDFSVVSPSLLSQLAGIGEHKVVFSGDYTTTAIGQIKYAGPDYGCALKAHFISVASEDEARILIKYLNSKFVRAIVPVIKGTSTKNGKTVFKSIPKVDLTRTWTDAELYAHFGLTEEEIAYIEATVK